MTPSPDIARALEAAATAVQEALVAIGNVTHTRQQAREIADAAVAAFLDAVPDTAQFNYTLKGGEPEVTMTAMVPIKRMAIALAAAVARAAEERT